MFCLAEQAGIVRCEIHLGEHQGSKDSDKQSQSSKSKCCSMHSDTALVVEPFGVSIAIIPTELPLKSDCTVPEGPVREIDHPPQLS